MKTNRKSKTRPITFVLNVGTVIVIAMAVEGFDIEFWPNGLVLGFGLGMAIYGFNLCSDFLFQNQSMKLLGIQVGYRVLCATLAGGILDVWR